MLTPCAQKFDYKDTVVVFSSQKNDCKL